MGFMMRANRLAAIHAYRDEWTKKAFDGCVIAAKDLIGDDGPIRPGVPVGRLTGNEWGWLTSTVVSTWVKVRSEQAVSEGWNLERASHSTRLEPDSWAEGAVASILPKLVEACPTLDWSRPVGAWEKSDIVALLLTAFNLIQRALAARDAAEDPSGAGGANPGVIARHLADPDVIARHLNAAVGNPRMTVAELKELNEGLLK
jgi:hypothetical protein